MSGSGLKGAIIAAGRGTRMGPFGDAAPKAVLPIANRPLIEHQIHAMRDLGVDEVVVLIGHKGYEIAKVLGDGERLGVRVTYVEQTQAMGIAHAVGRLEQHLDRPFVLMLGDIYFVSDGLREMVDLFLDTQAAAVLAVKNEPDPEAVRRNFAVQLRDDGIVTRVIEKPRHLSNRLKGVGIYLFSPAVFDAIRRTPKTAMRDEYELTESIQVMIEDGMHVRVADVIREDINLTFPADVLRCNLLATAGSSLVHDTARLHTGVQLEQTVVGANATIDIPIRLTRSVVLSNAVLRDGADLEQVIVTPTGIIDCRVPAYR
ncbi:MAG: sugar phosphate nucleotidyltransferase [Geminicoccaceae bacterium]